MDPCSFWKTFSDTRRPDPSEGVPCETLDAYVAHAEHCDACTDALAPMLDLLERELGGPLLDADDTITHRAVSLLVIIITHGPKAE